MKSLLKVLAAVVILGLSISVFLAVRSAVVFRITSIDPGGEIIPTTQMYIRIRFSQELQANLDTANIVHVDRAATTSTSNREIIIYLSEPVDEGKKLTIDIANIKSSKNKEISKKYTFTAKYVPFNKLSKEAQAYSINQTDNTEKTHSLLSSLPYETEDFSISYKLPEGSSTKVPLFIASKMINYADPFAAPDSPGSLALLRQSRDETFVWLKKNGYTPEKYQLVFSEPYLLNEYNGVYIKDFGSAMSGE